MRHDSPAYVASRLADIASDMAHLAAPWAKAASEFEQISAEFEKAMAQARLGVEGTVQERGDRALLANIDLRIKVAKCEGILEGCKAKFKALDREGSLLQSLLSKERDELRLSGYSQ